MLFRLFLLFTLVPVVELALLVYIGERIGVGPTVAVVLTTGVAGAWLARVQGLRALARLRQATRAGQFPGEEIFDGVLILGGGLLLLTPGFLTDLLGFCALLPGSRALLKAGLQRAVRGSIHLHVAGDTRRAPHETGGRVDPRQVRDVDYTVEGETR